MAEKMTSFLGIKVVENPSMLATGWFIKDAEGRILCCGTIGLGALDTPEAKTEASKIEGGTRAFDLLERRALDEAAHDR